MTMRARGRKVYRPYFLVGRKWRHLDSPTFHKRECAADYAGRFYLAFRWTIRVERLRTRQKGRGRAR